MIKASKYHGYGNDFLIVPSGQVDEARYREVAKAICDRNFGIGADGCIFLENPEGDRFPIRIFNPDGSEAGMSGNGTRCAAAYVQHNEMSLGDSVVFLTPSGEKVYSLLESCFPVWRYRSTMGSPSFNPSEIPFLGDPGLDSIKDVKIAVGRKIVRVCALWVGNPQCVVFRKDLPDDDEFEHLGRGLSEDASFPHGTNVSFVQIMGRKKLRIKIWERGVGPTFSSGTGCCGAAVAALDDGKVESPVEVETETGVQIVEWQPGEEIALTGKACFIADANIYL